MSVRISLALPLLAAGLTLAACEGQSADDNANNLGNPARGAELIGSVGCGGCHTVPGVDNASGRVGPPLTEMGRRILIAGRLPNTAPNMVAWLLDPQAIDPGNAMPDSGLSEEEARDVAAYLATLR